MSESVQAQAIYDDEAGVIVVCPLCEKMHKHSSTTGRLINIPAMCDASRFYKISATMRPKSVYSAMRGYIYDLNRRRKPASAAKAATAATAAATDAT